MIPPYYQEVDGVVGGDGPLLFVWIALIVVAVILAALAVFGGPGRRGQ